MIRGLPAELTSFIGRRHELAEGRRMLRAVRLVTLVGPGGVGKTRLALRLAHQVRRVFRDGVVWVDLAAQRDPASLTSDVASALGVDPQGQPAGEAVAAYLGARELLIVLDNCEHLVDACAQLVDGLVRDAPGLRVLTTSRHALRVDGEHLMSVEPLPVPTREEASAGSVGHVDAVALLVDRARYVHPGFEIEAANAEVAARLCRRLDGIPLAIELAAVRLRVLSLAQIVDRLDERFELLTAGARTGLPRHQTLRRLLDWSHELCSPAEQALWARMSVFDGGAELEAVERVCGAPGASTLELLAGLVDKSVVTVSENDGRVRFRMLETIREYGAARLAQRGETALMRDRHRDHFLGFARQARASWVGPHQLDWLARVNADLGNMRAALEHSVAGSYDRTKALELVISLNWYWTPAGAVDEGTRWFSRALPDDEESPLLLCALVAAASHAGALNDRDAGLRLARRAVSLPHGEQLAEDRAAHQAALATVALLTDDHEAAATAFRRSHVEYECAGDLAGQIEALRMTAIITGFLGRLDEAMASVEQAMRICDAHGEQFEKRFLWCYYGDLLWKLGRTDESLAAVRNSLDSWSVLRPVTTGGALELISRTFANSGQERRAAVLLGARERIWHDFGYQPGLFRKGGYTAIETQLVEFLGQDAFRAAYEEGHAMSLPEAVALALGHDTSAAPSSPRRSAVSVLSRREQQVAELVARGFSNKKIAEELVMSPRTAEGHVAKVMDKLGVRSRTQVAAWVTERADSATS